NSVDLKEVDTNKSSYHNSNQKTMETLNVVLKLNQIICHDEGDGPGSAEPYLWAIFFKIDGLSVQQNGVSLVGEAEFRFSQGSHENLPNHDVDPGEVIQIPSAVG